MKKIFLAFFIFSSLFSQSQNPLVKRWDYRYGGTNADLFTCFKQTADGGYILGGSTGSGIGGDKTEPGWGSSIEDFWIVKIDSVGNKQWDRDLGGLDWDEMWCLDQTADGGYIVGGWSRSGPGGNKTTNLQGIYDYWIVKLDANGNQQWDKDFGGTDLEDMKSVKQTRDGGYILGGCSVSGIGGDKTQPTWGDYDYWIVKTDSLGNKQWDKDFGGTWIDILYSVEQTTDGGYILGGYSGSDISGDKTQNTRGAGDFDYWIVKTDSLGNKLWDKDFGGTLHDQMESLQQTTDGGYILGGISYSDMGGDKTEPNWSPGFGDYWIVKVDANGIKQWDKDFGGTGYEDAFGQVVQTNDNGYLMSGTSYSPASGNKTEGNLGVEQGWMVKTDSLGNKQWDKTIFTPEHDEIGMAIQTKDSCYAFANYTDALPGGYKSQYPQGGADYWIVKFCETLQAGFTSPTSICPGSCIDFTNLSFQATSYQWSFPGATPGTSTAANPTNICYATPGSYDVQLIANNANGSDTVTLSNYITVYPSPPPQSITQNGDTLFAIPGATSYRWYFNGNIVNGATTDFYVAMQSGDYNVIATDANGCEVEAAIFSVIANAPFEVSGLGFEVYPNPVEKRLSVKCYQLSGAAIKISIYNVLGEKIYTAVYSEPFTVNCEPLPSGLYYIEITSSGKTFRSKFVKSTYR